MSNIFFCERYNSAIDQVGKLLEIGQLIAIHSTCLSEVELQQILLTIPSIEKLKKLTRER
ncbi:MAG: hypothetical protein IPJ40_18240 [Saprospirales bacterium]|nr:hypothetical protein [Saprospirales bacterium]